MLGRSHPSSLRRKAFCDIDCRRKRRRQNNYDRKTGQQVQGPGTLSPARSCRHFQGRRNRAARIWAKRGNAQVVKHQSGSDPSAVVFDAIEAARARDIDIVIIDTAAVFTPKPSHGRAEKSEAGLREGDAGFAHETLLVIDATNGQNALTQAKMFNETIGITGIALTKLDGTAKGNYFCHKEGAERPGKTHRRRRRDRRPAGFCDRGFCEGLFD